jgi:acyl-coenzyme A thioesterase PaaI-like protein
MATEPLLIEGCVVRAGRTMALFAASARQRSGGERIVAQATCVYAVRTDSEQRPGPVQIRVKMP